MTEEENVYNLDASLEIESRVKSISELYRYAQGQIEHYQNLDKETTCPISKIKLKASGKR